MSSDETHADMLVDELGRVILESEDFADGEWSSLAIVFNLDNRASAFGYRFFGAADWDPSSPSFDAIDIARTLQTAMRANGGNGWKKCLVRITRPDLKIDIAFDYDGTRWTPDIADPAGFALGLRR